jgi:thiamine biosynthesis lipoprotein
VDPSDGFVSSDEFSAMGTTISLKIHGGDPTGSLSQARQLVAQLEALWSRFLPDSDIGRLNRADGQPTAVDLSTDRLLRAAKRLAALTDGAYDPTLGAVIEAWEHAAGDPPDPIVIARAVSTAGAHRLEPITLATSADGPACADGAGCSGSLVWSLPPNSQLQWQLGKGAHLDLGGLAKGYTADAVRDRCRLNGMTGALVTFGTSSVAAWGNHVSGRPWRVGLAAVGAPVGQVIGHLELTSGAVSTSSNALRAGARLSARHVLDPLTGRPAESDVEAVSVVASTGVVAEAYSTAILVKGSPWALEQYRARAGSPQAFDAVIQQRGAVLVTPGLRQRLILRQRAQELSKDSDHRGLGG